MKDLPKVFHNKIEKNITNNEMIYYSDKKKSDSNFDHTNKNERKKNINQKINQIFSSSNYIYKANVEISLNDKKIIKRIIGRNKEYLITMDNELIKIDDIIDIKFKKK